MNKDINYDIIIENIKKIIFDEYGMKFEKNRDFFFRKRITRIINKSKFENLNYYYYYLKKSLASKNKKPLDDLIAELTINETFFYRDAAQFDYIIDELLPLYKNKNNISCLSLGCATGEEPFTIAMLFYDFFGLNLNKNIKIIGCDIDKTALSKCQNSEYSVDSRKLQYLPKNFLSRYFVLKNNKYVVSDKVKKLVNFKHLNILTQNLSGHFDFIFCKNIMIYISKSVQKKIWEKIIVSLKPGGYLILGSTELFDILPEGIERISFEGSIYRKVCDNVIEENVVSDNNDFQNSRIRYNGDYADFRNSKIIESNEIKNYLNSDEDLIQKKSEDEIRSLKMKEVYSVKLKGIIDKESDNESKKFFNFQMNQLFDIPNQKIIVDFSEVKYIDRFSLENILKLFNMIKNDDKDIVVIVPAKSIKNMMRRIKSDDDKITVFNSVEEAEEYFGNAL